MLASAVIYKQKVLHGNEIVQYLQNYKCQDVTQDPFKEPLQASTNPMKNNCPAIAHTFFTGCSILGYFLSLSCYNFRTVFNQTNFLLSKQPKIHITTVTKQEVMALCISLKFTFYLQCYCEKGKR